MRFHFKLHSSWRRKLSPSDTRRWLLRAVGFRLEIQRDPVWDFAIYWKRLLVALLLLGMIGYLGAVTALHQWWAREPEARVAWIDIALAPFRREKFREQRGDRMIALGKTKAERGKLGEAIFDLQAGLARSPRNLEGRIVLARVWVVIDRNRALKVIEDGLRLQPDNRELLAALFDLYDMMGAATRIRVGTAALLAPDRRPPLSNEARRVVVNARASLLLESEPVEALALLEKLPREFTSADGQRTLRLMLRAMNQAGRTADAAALLAQLPAKIGGEAAIDAELAVAAGDAAALESALRRWKPDAAEPVRPALFAIRAWHELKRPTLRARAVVEFLRFHGANERALQALGALAIELDLPLLLVRAEQEADKQRFNPFAFRVHATEIALRHGDIEEARRLLPKWENTLPELPEQQREVPELFARLIRAAGANGETQNAALQAHLARCGTRLSSRNFKLAIATLEQAGNFVGAAEVADVAARLQPLNEEIQAEQKRVAERLVQWKIAEARMSAATISPTPAARTEVDVAAFESGAAAVDAIDEALARRDVGRALQIVQAVRKASPTWLAEIEPTLGMREFRVRRAQAEMPAAMIVFRDLVLKPGLPRAAAFRLVRQFIAEGDAQLGLQLAREVVRLVPGERAATVLLKEAEDAMPAPATPTEKTADADENVFPVSLDAKDAPKK